MSRFPVALVACAAITCSASSIGWSKGNAGVDRPGSDYNVTVCDHYREQAPAQTCCFNMCMLDNKCEAWSYDLVGGHCHLKDSAPAQTVESTGDPERLALQKLRRRLQQCAL